jgi:hypothetical protein
MSHSDQVAEVLAVLDRQSELAWPRFNEISEDEYFAMRLVVMCERGTGDWGLVFEQVCGLFIGDDGEPASLNVKGTIFGPSVPSYAHSVTPRRHCALSYDEGTSTLLGPAGELIFDESLVAQLDLRPRLVCNLDHIGHPHHKLIRAYLARFPGSLFGPLDQTVRALSGTEDDVLFITDAFAHIEEDKPSASATYRSLAEAIVSRDATKFLPGTPNLDWRLWARNQADD